MDPSVPRQSFLSHVRLQSSPRETLRDGDTIRLTVISLKRGRAILSNSNLHISARNSAGLRRGDTVFVTVRRVADRLRLEILQRVPATSGKTADTTDLYLRFVRSYGFESSETGRSVFAALIASGRALSPQLYRTVYSRLSGHERRSIVRSEMELVDRGITIEEDEDQNIQELRTWLSGDGSDTPRRDDHRDSSSEDGPDRSGGTAGENEFIEGLKTFLHRSTSKPSHPVQLYNATLPLSGTTHWVVAPLRVFYKTREIEGVLKVGIDVTTRTTHTAILSVERPGGKWWFEWSVGNKLVLEHCGWDGEVPRPPDILLAKLGGTRHTTVGLGGDGFGIGSPEVIDGGIDRYG